MTFPQNGGSVPVPHEELVPIQVPQPVQAQEHVASKAKQPSALPVMYTREQKGHSLILHLTLGALVLWIPAIYISMSPRHYWHA